LRFDANGQADLFSWRPPKREPVQLSLFDDGGGEDEPRKQ
jgi:hypothetical protein